jgi:hypothetical protein
LYETQIGAAIFERGAHQFNPYPTFQSLIDNLDYIQKLGFDTLQIMPRQPCPSYSVYDYFDPVHQYGDDAGLRALVKEAHRRGMRVILDWLLHGAMDKEIARKVYSMLDSADDEHKNTDLAQYVLTFAPAWIESAPEVNPLRAKHPEWFMRDLEGRFRYIYTWAFDLQNRELQDYIIDAMKFYVRDFDVDGFRVDAPIWNVFPNWDPKISYRPSLSMTGSIRLLDRARPALRRLKPELMLYTEPSGPMFRRMFDVNYSYDELWAMAELLQWRKAKNLHYRSGVFFPDMGSRKPLNAYQFRLWLENRRRAQPKGSVSIHQVDSHDSFWWPPFEFKFRRQQYGVEGFRALFFMMATLDGGLMHYPTGEQGSEEFVRRILTLRRELPEIKHGRCEYLKVLVPETAVFAVSWETPSGWAVPLTNLGQAKLSVRAGLPRERFGWNPNAAYVVRDVFGNKPVNGQQEAVLRGRELDNLRVTLEPLESALLVTRERRN